MFPKGDDSKAKTMDLRRCVNRWPVWSLLLGGRVQTGVPSLCSRSLFRASLKTGDMILEEGACLSPLS